MIYFSDITSIVNIIKPNKCYFGRLHTSSNKVNNNSVNFDASADSKVIRKNSTPQLFACPLILLLYYHYPLNIEIEMHGMFL